MGAVFAARIVPGLLFASWAGAVIDRWDRRRVMVVCDLGRAAVLVSLPFVGSMWGLVVASLVLELLTLAWQPAKEASVPHLVPKDQLTTANSLSVVAAYATFPLAAGLFALLAKAADELRGVGVVDTLRLNQEGLAFYVDAATFLMSAAHHLDAHPAPAPPAPATGRGRHAAERPRSPRSWSTSARAGDSSWPARWSGRSTSGWPPGSIGGGMLIPLGKTFINDVLGAGNAGFGLFLFVLGLGMAAGVIGISIGQKRLPKSRIFTAGRDRGGGLPVRGDLHHQPHPGRAADRRARRVRRHRLRAGLHPAARERHRRVPGPDLLHPQHARPHVPVGGPGRRAVRGHGARQRVPPGARPRPQDQPLRPRDLRARHPAHDVAGRLDHGGGRRPGRPDAGRRPPPGRSSADPGTGAGAGGRRHEPRDPGALHRPRGAGRGGQEHPGGGARPPTGGRAHPGAGSDRGRRRTAGAAARPLDHRAGPPHRGAPHGRRSGPARGFRRPTRARPPAGWSCPIATSTRRWPTRATGGACRPTRYASCRCGRRKAWRRTSWCCSRGPADGGPPTVSRTRAATFRRRVVAGYRAQADADPGRWVAVDAGGTWRQRPSSWPTPWPSGWGSWCGGDGVTARRVGREQRRCPRGRSRPELLAQSRRPARVRCGSEFGRIGLGARRRGGPADGGRPAASGPRGSRARLPAGRTAGERQAGGGPSLRRRAAGRWGRWRRRRPAPPAGAGRGPSRPRGVRAGGAVHLPRPGPPGRRTGGAQPRRGAAQGAAAHRVPPRPRRRPACC